MLMHVSVSGFSPSWWNILVVGKNIQWLAPLGHLSFFFYHCTYHCDVMKHFDHGNKRKEDN